MTSASVRVLDSWAVVAWIRDEPAAGAVEDILADAEAGTYTLLMSWYNVAETFYSVAKRSNLQIAEEFMVRLPSLPIRIVLPNEDDIMAAARIKANHALAFGDAFAIALALTNHASVITGDDEIRRCELVPVDWVGG